jgi:hypothetical protein
MGAECAKTVIMVTGQAKLAAHIARRAKNPAGQRAHTNPFGRGESGIGAVPRLSGASARAMN